MLTSDGLPNSHDAYRIRLVFLFDRSGGFCVGSLNLYLKKCASIEENYNIGWWSRWKCFKNKITNVCDDRKCWTAAESTCWNIKWTVRMNCNDLIWPQMTCVMINMYEYKTSVSELSGHCFRNLDFESVRLRVKIRVEDRLEVFRSQFVHPSPTVIDLISSSYEFLSVIFKQLVAGYLLPSEKIICWFTAKLSL